MSLSTDLALDAGTLAALDDAVGADGAVTVMDIILESVPALREQLRAAAASGNLRGLIFAAHQLKSECAHVGATALSSRLQGIESGAADGSLRQPAAEVARVSAMVEKFLDLLRGVRNARAGAIQS
jgi:HPt (histidine-containing phosphotransfer) domain-containing protein